MQKSGGSSARVVPDQGLSRVALQEAPGAARIADRPRVVIAQDRARGRASAGKIPLQPPEKPAMKCGSMKPSTMRRSASTYSRFSSTSLPVRRAAHRQRVSPGPAPRGSRPGIARRSPDPASKRARRSCWGDASPCRSRSRSARAGRDRALRRARASSRALGNGRVMSGITTATRSEPLTSSRSGRPRSVAHAVAERGGLVPKPRHEARLDQRDLGASMSTSSPSRPSWRRTRIGPKLRPRTRAGQRRRDRMRPAWRS